MSRKVFIGGFASNKNHVNRVTDALSEHFGEDVEGMSFREAVRDQLRVDKLARSALTITHSAGMMTLRGSMPSEIIAVAPPIPAHSGRLVGRAVLKTARLTMGSFSSLDRFRRAGHYSVNAATELMLHSTANLGQLPNIGRFDSLQEGVNATKSGIDVTLGFMAHDAFGFQLEADAIAEAQANAFALTQKENGLTIVTDIAGEHDELLLYPAQTLESIRPKQS